MVSEVNYGVWWEKMKISIFGLSGLFYHQDRGHFFIFSRALFDLNWLLFADQNKAHFRYQGGDFQDMSRGFRIGPSFFKRSRLTFSLILMMLFINRTFYLFYGHFYQSRLSSLLSVISPTFWLFKISITFLIFDEFPFLLFQPHFLIKSQTPFTKTKINPTLYKKSR